MLANPGFDAWRQTIVQIDKMVSRRLILQEWLNENNFSERLAREYCEPMVGAIWSRTQGDVLDEFPILGVAQFLENHYMLDRSRPAWRVVQTRFRRLERRS